MDLLEVHKQEPEHLVDESDDLVKDLVKDAISRKAVLSKIKEVCFSEEWLKFRADNGSNGQRDFLINYIEQLPPATPQPKMGHWNICEVNQGGITEEWLECSNCMWSNALVIPRNYCPRCGMKMKEAQKRRIKKT